MLKISDFIWFGHGFVVAFTVLSPCQDVICGRCCKFHYSVPSQEFSWTLWHTNRVYRQRGCSDGADLRAGEGRSHRSWLNLSRPPVSLKTPFVWPVKTRNFSFHPSTPSVLVPVIVLCLFRTWTPMLYFSLFGHTETDYFFFNLALGA